MATLYSQADSNIRKTWILIILFLILIITLSWFFSYLLGEQTILLIGVFFSVIISFSSYWFSDKLILSMARAKLIEKKRQPRTLSDC